MFWTWTLHCEEISCSSFQMILVLDTELQLSWPGLKQEFFFNSKTFFTPHSPSCFLVQPFLTIMFAILPGPNFSFLQLAIVLPLWSRSFTDPSPWSVDWTSKYTSPSRSTTLNQILVDDSFQEIKHFTCSLHHSLSAWAQCSLSANIFLSASECPVVLELLEPQ